jgi:predicted CXXCH cytochrome family protein
MLLARTDRVCFTCHDKPLEAADGRTIPDMKRLMTTAKYLHGANKAGNCNACHDPHGSNQRDLLERTFPATFYARFDVTKYELCWTCHEKQLVLTPKTRSLTNFRNGDVNLHFVHVNRDEKGRSCKTCHDVHASDLPNHMASSVPFEGSNWAMPIEYQKTADGGSCTPGCHKMRSYSRSATTAPSTGPMTRGVP